jgi:hypothetical protein
MKRLFVSILIISSLLLSGQAKAQNLYYKQIHPNEISTSYGFSVLSTFGSVVIGSLSNLLDLTEGEISVKPGGTYGVINLGYSYQLNKTISIGGGLAFNRLSVDLKDNTGKISPAAVNIWTIMSTGKFDWFRTRSDMFGMYSKVGLGIMAVGGSLMEELHKTIWLPTGQLSLIGLEVGRGFSGFMELGFGNQGIAQLGVRARF